MNEDGILLRRTKKAKEIIKMYVADVKLGKHMRTTERVLVSALIRVQLAELIAARDFFSQSQQSACSNENPKQFNTKLYSTVIQKLLKLSVFSRSIVKHAKFHPDAGQRSSK